MTCYAKHQHRDERHVNEYWTAAEREAWKVTDDSVPDSPSRKRDNLALDANEARRAHRTVAALIEALKSEHNRVIRFAKKVPSMHEFDDCETCALLEKVR